jgi:hypothetical protein
VTLLVRRAAGGLTVVEALWLVYAYFDSSGGCAPHGCTGPAFIPTYSIAAPVLAALLIIVGALGVWGVSFTYLGGAILSAVALAVTAYTVAVVHGFGYLSSASNDAIIGVAFALVALLANLDAIRSKSSISEQANPMNLPVFG